MTVLGFHGGSHCQPGHAEMLRAAGAAMTFDDMRRLPDLIARIGRKSRLDLRRIVEVRLASDVSVKQSCRELTGRRIPQMIVSDELA